MRASLVERAPAGLALTATSGSSSTPTSSALLPCGYWSTSWRASSAKERPSWHLEDNLTFLQQIGLAAR